MVALLLVLVGAEGKALVVPGTPGYYQHVPRVYYYPVGRQGTQCLGLGCFIQGVVEGTDGVINAIGGGIGGIGAVVGGIGTGIGNAANGIGSGIGAAASGTGNGIGAAVGGTGTAIGEIAQGTGQVIGGGTPTKPAQPRVCYSGLFYFHC
eukprot:GFUD01105771.1.p1 GENE.GFUD01105771.1~~GFUD01105771.1.p1  ORF type:complete len:162 (-),score=29.79 GFUD01105771.1:233-682(-)